jgi:organic radical activating enzyme
MNNSLYIREVFSSIQGEGMFAGRRQIFVRLTECNLDCRYCDTNFEKTDSCRLESKPGSGRFISIPQPVQLQKITAVIAAWQSLLPGAHHSISFTGGEPLLEADSLAEWFPEIRKLIPIHLETNGTMDTALMRVIRHVDFISMDMKLPSTSGCTGHLWELHHQFLKHALGSHISVKIIVGDSTDADEVNNVCDILYAVDPSTPLFIQPLTLPDGRIGISAPHILALQELASFRLQDVRVIPQMHKLLGVL